MNVEAVRREASAARPNRIARPLDALAILLRFGVVVALATVLVFTVGQVVDRHVLATGFSAFDQYARLGLVWLTFLGIALGFRERANIRIDLLDHVLPARFVRWKGLVLDALVLVAAISIVVVGWRLLEVGAFQVLMDTPFTYRAMYAAPIVGFVAMALFLAARIADALTGGRLRLDDVPGDDDRA